MPKSLKGDFFYKISCQIYVSASGLEMNRAYNQIVVGVLQLISSDEVGIRFSKAAIVKESVGDDRNMLM